MGRELLASRGTTSSWLVTSDVLLSMLQNSKGTTVSQRCLFYMWKQQSWEVQFHGIPPCHLKRRGANSLTYLFILQCCSYQIQTARDHWHAEDSAFILLPMQYILTWVEDNDNFFKKTWILVRFFVADEIKKRVL